MLWGFFQFGLHNTRTGLLGIVGLVKKLLVTVKRCNCTVVNTMAFDPLSVRRDKVMLP